MSQDQSPTVIDATDADVLAPEAPAPVLTERQTGELEKYEFHLHRLGRKITAREVDLIYHYVEAGWWLLRAHEVHRCTTVVQRAHGQFNYGDQGFTKWLERPEINVARNTAYRWMQGAKNAGLTPESTILAIQTLRAEKKLHGHTLTDICRKPVDKEDKEAELHEITDEERAAEEEAERIARWEALAAQLHEHGVEKDEWAKLDKERREGLYDLLSELAKRIKPSLRKPKPVPALPDAAPAAN